MSTLIEKILHFIALIMASLLLLGCQEASDNSFNKEMVRPVKVAEVQSANGKQVKKFPATVEPTFDAQLAFRVNGEIAKIHILAGTAVAKGQLLAQLDDKDFKLQVKQAQARFDLVKSQFKRSEQLFKDKLIASSMFDEAKAQLDIAEAQLEAAKTNLQYTKLIAPFEGAIAQLHVENYEFVQAKQPIMELQGRDMIDIAIQVPEEFMAKLPKTEKAYGYQPTLILDTQPDKEYLVSIREYDIRPNPATKSYKLVFSMSPPEGVNILTGMTGSLFVELDEVLGIQDNSLLVPTEAVFLPNQFAGQDKHFVFKLSEEKTTELVEVNIVKMSQQGAIIIPVDSNQLSLEDKVVAAGSHLLVPGQKVKVWSRERGL